jgi:hypothetical protein
MRFSCVRVNRHRGGESGKEESEEGENGEDETRAEHCGEYEGWKSTGEGGLTEKAQALVICSREVEGASSAMRRRWQWKSLRNLSRFYRQSRSSWEAQSLRVWTALCPRRRSGVE